MKNKESITFASIVPLIGGESLGLQSAIGDGTQLPEYVLSYSPFAKNDSHYINYLRENKGWDKEYKFLDEDSSELARPMKEVHILNAVPPCAGLSSLSVSASADNQMNDWMYLTAKHALGIEKPQVFFGENAPRLFSSLGEPVVNKLREIGKKHGYTLSLYFTKSTLHGNPQKRPRTFYFFFKEQNKVPLFEWYNKDLIDVESILKQEISPDDPMNILTNKENPCDNPWTKYCMNHFGSNTLLDLYNTLDETTNLIRKTDLISESLNDVADWFSANNIDERFVKRAKAMQEKVDDNKGYWAHGVTIPKGVIPSLIGAMPHSIINPFKNSYLTIRDCLRLMRMPDDFNLVGDNPLSSLNHVCQNVIVSTSADVSTQIVKYLNGELPMIENTSFVKQNNTNQTTYFECDNQMTPYNIMSIDTTEPISTDMFC